MGSGVINKTIIDGIDFKKFTTGSNRSLISGFKGKFEEYEKKLDLNSDKKRFWSKELTSLDDKTFCDSVPIPINLDADLISKNEVEELEEDTYNLQRDL